MVLNFHAGARLPCGCKDGSDLIDVTLKILIQLFSIIVDALSHDEMR